MKITGILLFFSILISCKQQTELPVILYINSYHEGYPPSDGIMRGINQQISKDSFQLVNIFMDTKRNPDSLSIQKKCDSILHIIGSLQPEILLVSDDAALHYLVEPNQPKITMPVVYCGVNWSSSAYHLDHEKVTGMLEVLPLRQLLKDVRHQYPHTKTMAIVSENTLSEIRNKLLLDTLFQNAGLVPSYYLVNTFEEWKLAFRQANDNHDLLYLPTNGSITQWNSEEATKWVHDHIHKPVVTCDDFMMPYCVYGLTKVPEEQGIFVARTAKQILLGTKPGTIPETKNNQVEIWFNPGLGEKTGFKAPANYKVKVSG